MKYEIRSFTCQTIVLIFQKKNKSLTLISSIQECARHKMEKNDKIISKSYWSFWVIFYILLDTEVTEQY